MLLLLILETSKEPYVLFQSVYTLKEAAIREWLLLTPAVFNELETFLLNYIINNYKTLVNNHDYDNL